MYIIVIYSAAKEREKAQKLAQQKKAAEASSRLSSGNSSQKKGSGSKKSGIATPLRSTDARILDLSALNIGPEEAVQVVDEPPPKMTIAREKILEEATKVLEGKEQKKGVSLVVIGRLSELFMLYSPNVQWQVMLMLANQP